MVKSRAHLLSISAMAGVLALLAWGLHGPTAGLIAGYWRQQLEEAPAERAELLAGRMAQLGPPGIRALVCTLGSRREVAALAARRALWAELERWESLPAPAILRKLAVLAEALSESAKQFDVAARGDAAELAAEILRWLPDFDSVHRLDVIAHCDRVFEYHVADQPAATVAPVARTRPIYEAASRQPDLNVPQLDTPEMPAMLSAMPGGGLLPETLPALEPPNTVADRQARLPEAPPKASASGGPDGRLNVPSELLLPQSIRPLSAVELLPEAPRLPELPSASEGFGTAALEQVEKDDPLNAAETEALMRCLGAADPAVAARAEVVLRRRGFTDVHLELSRHLFDADPSMRIKLARTLPKLGTIDPVPWLLWLSLDPHAEVRLAAIGLMATTGDPALLARIRQMASQDSDPAVQRVARRLGER